MLKATKIEGPDERGDERWRIEGTTRTTGGRPVNAVITVETDGREAWWDEEDEANDRTGGIEPGFEHTGWDEVLDAITEYNKNG